MGRQQTTGCVLSRWCRHEGDSQKAHEHLTHGWPIVDTPAQQSQDTATTRYAELPRVQTENRLATMRELWRLLLLPERKQPASRCAANTAPGLTVSSALPLIRKRPKPIQGNKGQLASSKLEAAKCPNHIICSMWAARHQLKTTTMRTEAPAYRCSLKIFPCHA